MMANNREGDLYPGYFAGAHRAGLRGLFRVAVVTLAGAAAATALTCRRGTFSCGPGEVAEAAWLRLAQVVVVSNTDDALRFAALPLLAILAYLAVRWVINGFRHDD